MRCNAATGFALAGILGVLLAPSVSRATAGGAVAVTFPASVTVGQAGVPATIAIENRDTPPDTSNTVCNFGDAPPCTQGITLVPACGQLSGSACSPGREDPGVFAASPLATGRPGTACPGMVFDVTSAPPAGTLRITPQGGAHVVLPTPFPSSPGFHCLIDLSFTVMAMPIEDEQGAPGVQTAQTASAQQFTTSGLATANQATSHTTVDRATPALGTTASGDVVLGAGTLSDTATVSGRVNPGPGGMVLFTLFGPGDATCSAPVFTSNVPLGGTGTATSAAFAPQSAGPYRWIASYSGDANNAPVSGACNDPGESTVVTEAASPPPPPTPFAVADRDGDGIPDVNDTCPDIANADQRDADRDDIGDACDNSDASSGPTLKQTGVLRLLSGRVLVRPPSAPRFRPLRGAELVALGTVVDARNGVLALSSEPAATTATAETIQLTDAVFEIEQRDVPRPYTDINLRIPASAEACPPAAAARAAKVSPTRARLSANGRGRFRVRARNSRSTAPGTIWTTEERCDATVTRVATGRVEVADKRTLKLVAVTAGQSYVARAGRAR